MCADGKNFCLVMVAKDSVLAIKQYASIAVNTKQSQQVNQLFFVKVRRYTLSTKQQASAQVVTNQHYWTTCAS